MRDKLDTLRNEQTPFYLYDAEMIERNAKQLIDDFPSASILYSVKANPFPPVMRLIAQQGIGGDAASRNEVLLALDCGMKPEDIFYSAPGKTAEDIAGVLGKCTVIADSLGEIRRIEQIAADLGLQAKIGIRVNPDFSMFGDVGGSSKFGVDEEALIEAAEEIRGMNNVVVCGVHVHVRSQVLNTEALMKYHARVYDLAVRLKETCEFAIETINFGSGIGVVYSAAAEKPLDYARLSENFRKLAEKNERGLKARLLIESGRFLTCHAGTYVTEVVDIKKSRGKKYLVVKNGLNGFFKPAIKEMLANAAPGPNFGAEPLYTSDHAYEIHILTDEEKTEVVDIAGNLCTAVDLLAVNFEVPVAKIGDRVTISNAGSYAYTLSPLLFADNGRPEQYLVK